VFISYEDLLANTKKELVKIIQNLKLEDKIDYARLDRVIKRQSFHNRKKYIKSKNYINIPLGKKFNIAFMRKGVIGDWKNFFSPYIDKKVTIYIKRQSDSDTVYSIMKKIKVIFKKSPAYPLYKKILYAKQNLARIKLHKKKQAVIRHYQNIYSPSIFIETGTYHGQMVQAMKNIFKTIYSIELGEHLYKEVVKKFEKEKHVILLHGDSGKKLPKILSTVQKPCLFWLDAHYSRGDTAKGEIDTPINQELKSIFDHHIKNHIILIDDARCFNGTNDYPMINKLKEFTKQHSDYNKFEVQDDIIRIYTTF